MLSPTCESLRVHGPGEEGMLQVGVSMLHHFCTSVSLDTVPTRGRGMQANCPTAEDPFQTPSGTAFPQGLRHPPFFFLWDRPDSCELGVFPRRVLLRALATSSRCCSRGSACILWRLSLVSQRSSSTDAGSYPSPVELGDTVGLSGLSFLGTGAAFSTLEGQVGG